MGGQPRHESRTVQAACQGGHCCILLFYCDATLVLWWAVVEEVFSGVIKDHAQNPMCTQPDVGEGLPPPTG
ncbi:hypothetical protein CIB54_09655 [Pseudomonas fluorescens]|uniref:Uncharacterized protein n=1 Tax=Pseudomonas fluorescens TaxID=294 RepID=A0A2N1E8U2_PSEFL|nr:hypothetical protein CIB54_09655 [Pseudomonas fluorescens]